MDNYSFEIKNKNVIQNNIDKIKRSMKRLKDTINRSNRSKSNNYQNIKTPHQNYHHKNKNIIKQNNSELYYNLNGNNLKDFLLYNKTLNNANINLETNLIHKSPSMYNNNIEINLIKKKIDKSFNNVKSSSNYNYTLNNELKNNYIYGSFFPSRNKYNDDNNKKTETFLNNDLDNNNILTDFSYNIHQMNKSDYMNNIQINRNKSQKQIKAVYNLLNKNNFNDQNISKYSIYTKDLNINDYSLHDITLNTIDLNNKGNYYENNLKNQIQLYDNINKGLLIRYKNIIKNFKSANERNNLLINEINELKIKHQNLKYTNKIIEDEFNIIKNKILDNNNNKELLLKKNEDLKNKIDKYDEIILSLKKEINNLIEENEININKNNLGKIISDISYDNLQNKIE